MGISDKVISDLYRQASFLKCKARVYSYIHYHSKNGTWLTRISIFDNMIEDYPSQFGVVTKDKAIAELVKEKFIESKETKKGTMYKIKGGE